MQYYKDDWQAQQPEKKLKVIIVGAGIAGLSTAIGMDPFVVSVNGSLIVIQVSSRVATLPLSLSRSRRLLKSVPVFNLPPITPEFWVDSAVWRD